MKENDVDDVAQQLELSSKVISYRKLSLNLNFKINCFLKLKYCNNQKAIDVNEQQEFEAIIKYGLIHVQNILFSKTSTLLHKGKSPRKDVWKKLGRIATEFLNCTTYPMIPSYALRSLLNKAMGNKDKRIIQDYRKTVLLYCNYDEKIIDQCSDSRLGELDVAFFVLQIPKQYLTTSSTSSFGVE